MFNVAMINLTREHEVFLRLAEMNYPEFQRVDKVVNLITSIILQFAYDKNPYREYFRKNKLIPSGGEDYVPELSVYLEEWIEEFTKLTMYENSARWIDEIRHNIWEEVKKFYQYYPTYLIRPEYKNGVWCLVNHGDIRALRYIEAVDHFEIEKEINSN